jgi:hypothetical protein
MDSLNRRAFLKTSIASGAALAVGSTVSGAQGAEEPHRFAELFFDGDGSINKADENDKDLMANLLLGKPGHSFELWGLSGNGDGTVELGVHGLNIDLPFVVKGYSKEDPRAVILRYPELKHEDGTTTPAHAMIEKNAVLERFDYLQIGEVYTIKSMYFKIKKA